MCFPDFRHITPLVNNHFIRHPYINERALADVVKAYSNTQDGTSSKNSNVNKLHPRHLIRH